MESLLDGGLEADEGGVDGSAQRRAEDVRDFVHGVESLSEEDALRDAGAREAGVEHVYANFLWHMSEVVEALG